MKQKIESMKQKIKKNKGIKKPLGRRTPRKR